jgi:hypothetical protein
MSTGFMRAALLCTLTLALTGCIFSRRPLFDIGKGATDIPVGRFELKSPTDKSSVQMARHGKLYLYGDDKNLEKAIVSFHPIGDGFYLAMAVVPGGPIHYGVLDARSKDKLPFVLLECSDTTPRDLIPTPDAKDFERCNATDRRRLIAIADRYKSDMMANRIAASKLFEYTPIP